jgi:hypothetical protein
MDKAKSSETGYSGNMLEFPMNKEERVLAHILATKFHTETAIDLWLEVRLNPTMKDCCRKISLRTGRSPLES